MTSVRPTPTTAGPWPTKTQLTNSEVKFFDEFVEAHGDYDVLGEGAYRRLTSMFSALVRPQPGERCLDLGCGTGAFTKRLRPFDLDLTGMDISPAAVRFAQSKATTERFICGDITATGLGEGTQDIILYSGVLHHFPTPEDREKVLTEGLRLLAPGGRMFAFDPNLHSPSMWLYRDPSSPLFSPEGKTENEILLSRATLKSELRAAGFADVVVTGVSGISFKHIASKSARLILPLYNTYEQIMRYSPFERFLGTFVVSVARKA